MNIGKTLHSYRLQKGMSQGDIEKRTACCAVICRT